MNSFLPYRHFAALANERAVAPPEPLTARERTRLSGKAWTERLAHEVAYLGGLKILTDRQAECVTEVKQQLNLVRSSLPGSQDSVYVIGPTGTGKSSAVLTAAIDVHNEALAETGQEGCAEPTVNEPGWSHAFIPVLFVNIRADAKHKTVSGQILSQLTLGEPSGTANTFANQLQKILPRHATRLIVLDDTHNLGTDGADAGRILQTVKNLNTDLGFYRISFVYLGNPHPDSGELNLAAHPQLAQRLLPFEVNHFDFDMHAIDDPPQNLAWAEYLQRWEQALMFVLPDLNHGEIASLLGRRLWNKTHGSPGALINVLKRHTQDVLSQRSGRLTINRDGLLATPVPMKYQRAMFAER